MEGCGFIPFTGGVVPGTQLPGAVVDGAQFIVPSGAGVAAGVVVFAGVVVSVPGAGVVVAGVTTPGAGVGLGTAAGPVVDVEPAVPAAPVPALPVPV